MMQCYFCKKEIPGNGSIGRQDTCDHCGGDLHICYHCDFYDRTSYNECREPQAERVLEKDRSNFCDYFRWGGGIVSATNEKDEAKKKLEEFFKK